MNIVNAQGRKGTAGNWGGGWVYAVATSILIGLYMTVHAKVVPTFCTRKQRLFMVII